MQTIAGSTEAKVVHLQMVQVIIGQHSSRPFYIVDTPKGEVFAAMEAVGDAGAETSWHWSSPPIEAPSAPAKMDYQKMAADALASIHTMQMGLDPMKPDFGKQVAAALKSGRMKMAEPVEDKPMEANKGDAVRGHLRVIEGNHGDDGSKIVVGYRHKKIGERGND